MISSNRKIEKAKLVPVTLPETNQVNYFHEVNSKKSSKNKDGTLLGAAKVAIKIPKTTKSPIVLKGSQKLGNTKIDQKSDKCDAKK